MRTKFFLKDFVVNTLVFLLPLLIIAPYSIFRASADNTKTIERSMAQTLNQCNDTIENLYSHMDNANIYFSSNPKVKLQLSQAFNEKNLSLNSLKNIETLSLYFQNLMFTDLYINEIYVYYNNDNQRIYKASVGALQPISYQKDTVLMEHLNGAEDADFWIDVHMPQEGTNALSTSPSLYFYQRLYSRSNHRAIGVLAFEFNLDKLAKYIDTVMQYNNQVIYLLDYDYNLVYTNDPSAEGAQEVEALLPTLRASADDQGFHNIKINDISCKSAFLRSARNNGFIYFTYTPDSEIYKTSQNLSTTYSILMLCAIGLSVLLAFYKSKKEYGYLCSILDIFSNPTASQQHFEHLSKSSSDPFEYIIINIIHLFIQKDYLKVQATEKEYKIQMLKMQALQHQINPHFLHNTLNSIYWETVKMGQGENPCSTMVSNLSSVIRYSLSDPMEDVTVEEEVHYLEQYLAIMKVRYVNKFNVEFRIDPNGAKDPLKKMLLQPLVENAIYHGIKEKEGIGKICVGSRCFEHATAYFIYDDGIGMHPARVQELNEQMKSRDEIVQQHMGLSNANLRLKLAYGEKARIHIKSKEGVYTLIYFFVERSEVCDVCPPQ